MILIRMIRGMVRVMIRVILRSQANDPIGFPRISSGGRSAQVVRVNVFLGLVMHRVCMLYFQ